jgi:hypothetical protein
MRTTITVALQVAALVIGGLTGTAGAQSAPAAAPVADAFRSIAQREGRNIVAAAEEMPGEKYGFKPTPAQMSFGEVVAHLIAGNDYLCSQVSGVAAPKRNELPKGASKDELVGRLRETFDFCESALGKVTDASLGAKVPLYGDNAVTLAAAMLSTAQEWAGHYSQMAVYLRLNGRLPPTARRGML